MKDQEYDAKTQHTQQQCAKGGRVGCCDYPDTKLDSAHVLLMRITGVFCILFGLTELGLGGAIHNYLTNVTFGAWWGGILTVVAGITAVVSLDKNWVISTGVFASVSCLINYVGAVWDGVQSTKVLNLTACTSGRLYNYGDSADYGFAKQCVSNQAPYGSPSNGCYCVAKGGKACAEYLLSPFAEQYKQNCGNILKNYANMLTASTAVCVVSSIFLLFLSILTYLILSFPPSSAGAAIKNNVENIEDGVTREGHT
jgi:hypothetical protein